jgi:hypothetical protein
MFFLMKRLLIWLLKESDLFSLGDIPHRKSSFRCQWHQGVDALWMILPAVIDSGKSSHTNNIWTRCKNETYSTCLSCKDHTWCLFILFVSSKNSLLCHFPFEAIFSGKWYCTWFIGICIWTQPFSRQWHISFLPIPHKVIRWTPPPPTIIRGQGRRYKTLENVLIAVCISWWKLEGEGG